MYKWHYAVRFDTEDFHYKLEKKMLLTGNTDIWIDNLHDAMVLCEKYNKQMKEVLNYE